MFWRRSGCRSTRAPNSASIYDDADVCAEVTNVEVSNPGNSFVGLLFWYVDDKNFYSLEIDADGYASIWRRQNGQNSPRKNPTMTGDRPR